MALLLLTRASRALFALPAALVVFVFWCRHTPAMTGLSSVLDHITFGGREDDLASFESLQDAVAVKERADLGMRNLQPAKKTLANMEGRINWKELERPVHGKKGG